MREYLEEESASKSEDKEEMQRFADLNQRILNTEQRLMEDKHHLLHDEICVNAVDERGQEQAMWIDCDMRMINMGERVGRRTIIALFQITYMFDGTKVSRRLYEVNTHKEMTNELAWKYREKIYRWWLGPRRK